MDELDRSIRRAKGLINRARLKQDLRAESQALSALRDFQNIQARYKAESVFGNSIDERLAAFLADSELQTTYWDWLIRKHETTSQAIDRIKKERPD